MEVTIYDELRTMKIFLDTADIKAIEDGNATGLIDGVTTNPSLILNNGGDPEVVYQSLIELGIPDISMEVVGTRKKMYTEGLRLVEKFGKDQTTIKVPCTLDGLSVCYQLAKQLIKVNVTLIFSPAQAVLASKAGAKYVSPFVGRVDDNSFGGLCLIKDIANIYSKQQVFNTEILAASIRNVRDVGRAFEYGAHICTIPPKVFEGMYNHILTDKGLELFDADWRAVNDNISQVN
jgi:transaldolase